MKNLWIILTIGVALRLFLSFATFHPDLAALSKAGRLVAEGHILDIYDFSSEQLIFNYPPIIYWFMGLLNFLFSENFGLLKLGYLIFDVLLGFLLYRLVDPKKAISAFSIWMFNPVSLYATYMMGQFDIIPTFFSVLCLYLVVKNKLSWAALSLGIGVAFKLYPLFLIVPLIFLVKGVWEKIKLGFLSVIPYLVSILPYLSSESFRASALFANQSSKSLYASIPVSGGESILLFPALLLFFYLLIWKKIDKSSIWKFFLIPLLLFFIFTHYHPQWLIWVSPFIILALVYERFKNIVAVLLIFFSWFGSLFFFDPSLTIGMFAPIIPAFKNTENIWTLFNINLDYNFSRSILQTVLAASSFYLIFHFFTNKENV